METSRKGNNGMTHQSSRAYACVAYRIMEYEGQEMSEEYLSILMEMLYDFYTESEIKKSTWITSGLTLMKQCQGMENKRKITVNVKTRHGKLFLAMLKKYHVTYQFTTIHSLFYSLSS